MMEKILSVVTLAFNQRPFIHRALASVPVNPCIEHIVVDPGSSDGTTEYLESTWSGSKTLLFKKDSSPGQGLNNGFSIASGQYGYFLNADDFLLPGAISVALEMLHENTEYDVFLGGGYVLDLKKMWARELIMPTFHRLALSLGAFPFFQQGMFFRMDAFHKAGKFNENRRTQWDGEFLIDLVLRGARIRSVSHQFGVFVLHESSISGSGSLSERYREESAHAYLKLNTSGIAKLLRSAERLSPLARRLYAWRWALADLRDRLLPAHSFRKVMAVYESLAENA